MKPNQSIVMVFLDSVAFYSPDDLALIARDKSLYDSKPLLFLVFSYIKNMTFIDLMNALPVARVDRKGNWTVVKFTKLNK